MSTQASSLSATDADHEPEPIRDRFGYRADTGYKATTRRTFDRLSQEVIRATVEDLATGETTTRDYLANLTTAAEAALDLLSLVTTGKALP